ncbi:unnamed protein product [Miscanthus lutarioriparius]|uniref:Protein kinase domain-containing protein n=1 Tax=Miscanthus lutarioriparius TaxID=422564 RepID=A0A811PAI4_9POAL|nr:unnamed protein product [Miscanthus lutarioriparius]
MANHTAASLLLHKATTTRPHFSPSRSRQSMAATYGDVLASWNGSTGGGGYCSWEGVRCRGSRQQPRVVALSLPSRGLTGVLSPAVGNLSSLRFLNLSSNALGGAIPASLDRLRHLHTLDLSNNAFSGLKSFDLAFNYLSGEPPRSLYNLSSLEALQIHGNKLHRSIPAKIGSSFPNMSILSFSWNQFTGSIPASLTNLTALHRIELSANRLRGRVPPALGRLQGLQLLYLFQNDLEADDRKGWEFITSLSNCSQLQDLNIADNSFTGQLPSSIGNLSTTLQILRLDYLDGISGSIPSAIGNLVSLEVLGFGFTSVSGVIPDSMGKLGNLIFKLPLLSKYLDLSSNSLSGPLPSEVGSLVNLNHMYLSGNQLSGELPDSIGECIMLQELSLENNSLEGQIPQSMKNIKDLVALNLSMNNLSGTIPEGIGTIRNLQQLDLAHNNLSGPIPLSLQNLTSLSELDLSFNNLQGELHLLPCHKNSPKKNKKRRMKSLTVALATTAAFLFLAFMVVVFRLICNKHRQRVKNLFQPPIIEEQYEKVSYHALENGTNGFSETNLLGKGSFGMVYKCTFQDEGTLAAVKVFNLEQSGSNRSFVAECEVLRRFMPNGSLSDCLHPKSSMPTVTNTLSIIQRLNVAVDIMDGLDYLHNHCQPPIIHCDLKPNNILLAEDMSARVGDFGISRILPETAKYGEGSSVSTLGDVYSQGILLLEMFTGRSPTDDMFRGSFDLHKFSEDALPERIWEMVDTTMWLHTNTNDITTTETENCLVSIAALGISCSKKQPRERTPIQVAAIKMHDIRDSY